MGGKKFKILYDTTFLSFASNKNSSRSGIYFVTYNILRELLKHPEAEVSLYCDYKRFPYMKDIIEKNETLKSLAMVDMKDISPPAVSFIAHMNYLCRNEEGLKDNILKKFVRFITYRFFHFYDSLNIMNPILCREIKHYDAYFSSYYIIPKEFSRNKKLKRFLFLHDVIPVVLEEFYGSMNYTRGWYKDLLNSLNKKDYYFSNSECTKRDFVKYAPEIDEDKILVTYLGANENFYQENDSEKINAVKKKYNIPQDKKYIFSLCTLEPRKNLIFAIKNFIEFIKKNKFNADSFAGQARNDVSRTVDDFVFVLGGGHWDKFLPQLEKEISDLNEYKNKILKIGYVDDEDLAALYSGAEMFVYPSIYEGFGMPVLEAMQCGCPVITSNVSSLPEVIGDCGIQINPYSDEEMISAYEKMYFDKEFASECSRKGLERANSFTWKNCVDKIVKQIEQVL